MFLLRRRKERTLSNPRTLALLGLGLTLAACSNHKPVESRDVATRDVSAYVTVTRLTDGTPRNRVEVQLAAPGGYLELAPTDRLQITVAGTTTPFAAERGPYGVLYRADVSEVGGDHLLDLLRDGERSDDHDVVGAIVSVPGAFTLVPPAGDVSRRAPFTFSWDAGIGVYDVTFSIAGPCLVGLDRKLSSDTGTYVINAAELADVAGKPAESCDATITMVRDATTTGALVTGGGYLQTHAAVTRTATFRSSP